MLFLLVCLATQGTEAALFKKPKDKVSLFQTQLWQAVASEVGLVLGGDPHELSASPVFLPCDYTLNNYFFWLLPYSVFVSPLQCNMGPPIFYACKGSQDLKKNDDALEWCQRQLEVPTSCLRQVIREFDIQLIVRLPSGTRGFAIKLYSGGENPKAAVVLKKFTGDSARSNLIHKREFGMHQLLKTDVALAHMIDQSMINSTVKVGVDSIDSPNFANVNVENVMAFTPGQIDLESLLKVYVANGNRLSEAQACALIGQMFNITYLLNRANVIHSDMKPANIVVNNVQTTTDGNGHGANAGDAGMKLSLIDFDLSFPGDIRPVPFQGTPVYHVLYYFKSKSGTDAANRRLVDEFAVAVMIMIDILPVLNGVPKNLSSDVRTLFRLCRQEEGVRKEDLQKLECFEYKSVESNTGLGIEYIHSLEFPPYLSKDNKPISFELSAFTNNHFRNNFGSDLLAEVTRAVVETYLPKLAKPFRLEGMECECTTTLGDFFTIPIRKSSTSLTIPEK